MANLKYVSNNTEYELATVEKLGFLIRQNSTSYSVGDTVFCSALPSGLLLECITAGTSASSVPNFSGAAVGGTGTDGTVTWLFQKFSNSEDGNGAGIEIGDVFGFTAVGKHGRCLLTWTDPSDVVVEGTTLARWKGTLIVRKAGSVPVSKIDGVVVVDSVSRNAYASTPFVDTGLTDGAVYYYRAFPHTTGSTYTIGSSVSCTPAKEDISVPVFVSGMTYTGLYQNAVFTGYDSSKMSISGDVGGTNVGSYTATFSLTDDDYKWSGSLSDSVDVVWSIGKADGSVSLSPSSLTLDTSTLSDTVVVTRSGDGAISAVSSDTDIATVSVSGTMVTVTAVASGNATVTVSVAEGTNYLAVNGTVSVTVQLRFVKPLNECTPAEIQEVVNGGYAAEVWDVGDKTVAITLSGKVSDGLTLNNYSCHAVLIGLDHNKDLETGGKSSAHFILGKNTSDKDIAFCDFPGQSGGNKSSGTWFNHSNTNVNSGGWKSSNIRTNIMPNFIAVLPAAWQGVLGTVTKYTDNTGGSSDAASYVTATSDKMFLLAEFEAFGVRHYANSAEKNEQMQYAYYANGNSGLRYHYQSSSYGVLWWLRSVNSSSSDIFCCVLSSGSYSDSYARYTLGVAPGFAIVANN